MSYVIMLLVAFFELCDLVNDVTCMKLCTRICLLGDACLIETVMLI